jgi:iron complex transport system substrate-binding protein
MGIIPVLKELGMEVVTVPTGFEATPETFRAMGRAFDRVERGEALGAYAEETLARLRSRLADLPPEKRPRIYLALDSDGLASICRYSDRSEAVVWAGGENVYECPSEMADANLRLGIEEVMRLDPDYVLVFSPELAANINDDPAWGSVRAVREGRWRLVPRGPFSWLERPATYMRLIGVQWLANWLHPDLYPLDLDAELERFMRLFFGVTPKQAGLGEFTE